MRSEGYGTWSVGLSVCPREFSHYRLRSGQWVAPTGCEQREDEYFNVAIFQKRLDIMENGKNFLPKRTKRLYDTAGVPFNFNMAGTDYTTHHVNEVMKQLSDQFIQDWFGQLNSPGSKKGIKGSHKLRTYIPTVQGNIPVWE